jgi:beta-glucosidase
MIEKEIRNKKMNKEYHNNNSVDKSVKQLLASMNIDEKIAQLGSAWVYELLEGKKFSEEKAAKIMKNGIGQITRLAGASNFSPDESAGTANMIQKFLVGNTRLGIPAIIHEESCSGYMAKGATCFPQIIGLAGTWEPELLEKMGMVIREQMRAVGARQALAPVLDVARDARWGRVEETFGEDPYLISVMGANYIKGIQGDDWKSGIMATAKHFAGYGWSEGGMNWAPAHIPEREMREVFLLPFEVAVRIAKIAAIMPGYHELDGIPCHSSEKLLRNILRDQWNFNGMVVSDYFGINMLKEFHLISSDKKNAAKKAMEAGVDIELPSTDCYGEPLKEAFEKGMIDELLIDRSVARILKMKFLLGLFENPYVNEKKVIKIFDTPDQRDLAKKIAQKSIVLLKNNRKLLPVKKNIASIAVIGPNANESRNIIGDYAYPCHIESLIETKKNNEAFNTPIPDKLDMIDNFVPIKSILEGIKEKVGSDTIIYYEKGCDVIGIRRDGFDKAVDIAKKSKLAVVVVGDKAGLADDCTSGETRDRAILDLPGVQEELVKAVYETGTPVVIVLINGRPLSISWINDNIPAIIEAWLPGEEGAGAVADVLFGDYNPGGKLPISFPRAVGQVPVYYRHKPSGGRSFWKGNYVEMSTRPLYNFGYGLSYTDFEYSNLNISPKILSWDNVVKIRFDLENKGSYVGDEVVQLYINDMQSEVTRPVKELKGFKRINLEPGGKKKVTFSLPVAQLGFYNKDMKYIVEPGTIKVMVGSSSEDIRLTGEFEIKGMVKEIKNKESYFSSVIVR